ncbi:hypothetical protein L6261_00175 [Candidatus Parcubacteria bacterium]|nr:hypothetical protein [Candidatus Parcubacteria bacterium]
MKKYKQLTVSIFLISLLIPSVAFASWWNPISWFKNKETAEISIQVSTSTPEIILETQTEPNWFNPISWFKKEKPLQKDFFTTTDNNISTTNNDLSAVNNLETKAENVEIKKAELKVETKNIETEKAKLLEIETAKAKAEAEKYKLQVEQTRLEMEKLKQENEIKNQTQTKIETKKEENKNTIVTLPNGGVIEIDEYGKTIRTIKEAEKEIFTEKQSTTTSSLEITQANVYTGISSAIIEWETNIPTESKIFVTGGILYSEIFNSESGLSTKHQLTIRNLSDGTSYNYEIEAVSGTVFSKQKGSFKTISTVEVLKNIKMRIDLNENFPCSNFGFNTEEILVCEYYKLTK